MPEDGDGVKRAKGAEQSDVPLRLVVILSAVAGILRLTNIAQRECGQDAFDVHLLKGRGISGVVEDVGRNAQE